MMPHTLEAILNWFPLKTNLWTVIRVAAAFQKFWIKRRKRELSMEIFVLASSHRAPNITLLKQDLSRTLRWMMQQDLVTPKSGFCTANLASRARSANFHHSLSWMVLQMRMKSKTMMHNPVYLQALHTKQLNTFQSYICFYFRFLNNSLIIPLKITP